MVKKVINQVQKPISQQVLFRAVASSTAIETGQSIKVLEQQLRNPRGKFQHLVLAR